jgi:hypothetical protein
LWWQLSAYWSGTTNHAEKGEVFVLNSLYVSLAVGGRLLRNV